MIVNKQLSDFPRGHIHKADLRSELSAVGALNSITAVNQDVTINFKDSPDSSAVDTVVENHLGYGSQPRVILATSNSVVTSKGSVVSAAVPAITTIRPHVINHCYLEFFSGAGTWVVMWNARMWTQNNSNQVRLRLRYDGVVLDELTTKPMREDRVYPGLIPVTVGLGMHYLDFEWEPLKVNKNKPAIKVGPVGLVAIKI